MKSKILLLVLFFCSISYMSDAQWSNKSFTFQTKVRQYRVYVPTIYNPSNPASLIITLHGLGDNMTNFSGIGMNLVADTANIIVMVPQALSDPLAGTAWNSGAGMSGYFPNSAINDVAFLNALMDTAEANYSINPAHIYICGFSMGGFMTERMACESNTRVAAFASVAGTIGIGLTQCNPGRPIPIAHFHGTGDQTVSYTANTYGVNTDSLIHFWINNNQCDTPATFSSFPDLVADGFTVDHFIYPNGQQGSEVELFRANGADHQWLYPPANDISYTIEIWKFFRKHELSSSLINHISNNQSINIFPNPVLDLINIKLPQSCSGNTYNIELINIYGQNVLSKTFTGSDYTLSLNNKKIDSGIYFIKVSGNDLNYSKKVLIN
jgi:polyhydroxybutyrate depolymerase